MKETSASDKPWLKFYDAGVPASIDYPSIPLDRLLSEAAAKHPDQPAAIFGGRLGRRVLDRALSYQELDQAVNRLATALQRLGLSKGGRVPIVMPNCPQFVMAFYAVLRAGGIAAPSNFLYTAGELERQVNDAGSEIAIVLSSFYHKVDSIRDRTPLRHIIVTNIKECFPPSLRLLFTLAKERKGGHHALLTSDRDTWLSRLLKDTPPTPTPVPVDAEDTACLLSTGGTTGVAKAAQLTHRNLVSNAVMANAWAASREGAEIIIGALPLFHSYGMTSVMNMAVARALTMVLIPDPRDVLHVMGAISKHRATFYPGVPVPDTDARIVDLESGEEELPVGEIGELIVRGPQVVKGYWQQPTETANVLREHPALGPGKWLHTGDIARMDEEGYFQIVDRKKDMIICGGFNVYPREVEEETYTHPAVQEVAVAGIADEYRGETVKAFVVLREGLTASEEEIIAFCREHLARYKAPAAIEFRSELPKSAVGKVLRRELARGDGQMTTEVS